MSDPTTILEKTVNIAIRCVCVSTLILLFFAVGVGDMTSRDARTQESPPMDSVLFNNGLALQPMAGPDTSTAEVKVAPTETLAPTATPSPELSTDRSNKDKVRMTLIRFKTHSTTTKVS
jgi:hypothetical protein